MEAYKYTITQAKGGAGLGQDITVEIASNTAKEAPRISHVRIVLDGAQIMDKNVNPVSSFFRASFTKVGSFTPGSDHNLVVEVKGQGPAVSDGAFVSWRDP